MTIPFTCQIRKHPARYRRWCNIVGRHDAEVIKRIFKNAGNITMKFAQDSQDEGYVITAYCDDSVSVNGKTFDKSLIITKTKLDEHWNVDTIDLLLPEHIEQILIFNPELVIIGTGNKLIFPAVETYSGIIARGIGVDFMDTRAACRTYNILMSEGRDVVAGLIL